MADSPQKTVPAWWRWLAIGAILWGGYHWIRARQLDQRLAGSYRVQHDIFQRIPEPLRSAILREVADEALGRAQALGL
jgi:hypothetical protein